MASKAPLTPSPSPPPSIPPATPSSTLSAQINLATKRQHVKLNSLIVDRLKLALPPNAHDPRLLGQGLAAFAHIYLTFEEAWDSLIQETAETPLDGSHEAYVNAWLAYLRPAGLPRSARLAEDVKSITLRTQSRVENALPNQQQMLERVTASILQKPHTLVAYAWVMYMATFSGGRWIRQQLFNAGPEFWAGTSSWPGGEKQDFLDDGVLGFSFLSFAGRQDGEDIKAEFKSRLVEADTLLTAQERQDVVIAAVDLFGDCISLVEELDRTIWWQMVAKKVPSFVFICVLTMASLYLLFGRRIASAVL